MAVQRVEKRVNITLVEKEAENRGTVEDNADDEPEVTECICI